MLQEKKLYSSSSATWLLASKSYSLVLMEVPLLWEVVTPNWSFPLELWQRRHLLDMRSYCTAPLFSLLATSQAQWSSIWTWRAPLWRIHLYYYTFPTGASRRGKMTRTAWSFSEHLTHWKRDNRSTRLRSRRQRKQTSLFIPMLASWKYGSLNACTVWRQGKRKWLGTMPSHSLSTSHLSKLSSSGYNSCVTLWSGMRYASH